MLLGKERLKGIVLSLALATVVWTAPTVGMGRAAFGLPTQSPSSLQTSIAYVPTDSSASPLTLVRAILMVLIGFICVPLVRDRRFWLDGAKAINQFKNGPIDFVAIPRGPP